MGSLVLDLQADAMDEKKSVVPLLQKARAVSVKLNVATIQDWIQHELEGYPDDLIPNYREVSGNLLCLNPMRGHVPLGINDVDLKKMLTTRLIGDPLPALFDLLNNKSNSRQMLLGFPPEASAMIKSRMSYPMEPWLAVEISSVQRIVASVKTKILDFALDLEQQGVLGDGMTFSNDEKDRASHITYNLNIEKMTDSQIQQGTTNSTQNYTKSADIKGISSFVERLLPAIGELNSSTEREQIRSDLETIRSLIKAPSPRFNMIRECLNSVKTILEGTTGNVLAATYLPLLTPLLASIPS